MQKENKIRQKRADIPGKERVADGLTGMVGFLFLLTFSVVLVLNFRLLYYHDVHALHLAEKTGLTEEQICQNYDELIDYNLFWKKIDTLKFSDFPMSQQGSIHFEEVKHIFLVLQYAMPVFLFLFAAAGVWKLRRNSYGFLRATALSAVIVPVIVGAFVAMNWEGFFIGFHKLVFSNDYWLFDPAKDPVILILPDEFFFHCAAAVIVCIAAGGILCEIAYRVVRGKE